MKMQKLQTVAFLAIVLLLLGIVGALDAEDARRDAEYYCDMVDAGYWPDYRGTYLADCRNVRAAK